MPGNIGKIETIEILKEIFIFSSISIHVKLTNSNYERLHMNQIAYL